MKFGRLTVVEQCGRTADHRIVWYCRCTCGRQVKVSSKLLTNGATKSCGCLRRQLATKHGYSKTTTYRVWQQMIQRCHNPRNDAYADYGGRGVTVSPEWKLFENFLKDMGEAPEDQTLDRIDNQKGYCKSNCRWASKQQQAQNRRDNLRVTYNGKTRCLSDWAHETGIKRATIKSRLDSGWPVDKSLTKPARKYRKT